MSAELRAIATLALACATCLAGATGRAQECPPAPPDAPLEATPAAGATNVTLDAVVRIRYTPGYFGSTGDDPAMLLRLGFCPFGCGSGCSIDEATPVAGLIQLHGDDLVFVPDEPLLPRTAYVAHALGVDGELDVPFCTGSRLDLGPPTLGAIDREAPVRVGPQCGLTDGGYRVGVYFEPAIDDGPPGSVEYLLYLTRGVGVDAPRLISRSRNYAAAQITMSLLLEPELGTTPVCVQIAAVDGVGNVSVSDERHCFDPITRTWFYGGCSASSPATRTRPSAGIVLGALGLCAALSRRRRRSRRRPIAADFVRA